MQNVLSIKQEQDRHDRQRQDMQDNTSTIHSELTETILACCFDVMNELGTGFLESVYKNALFIAIKERGLTIEIEKRFEVLFKGRKVGLYIRHLA